MAPSSIDRRLGGGKREALLSCLEPVRPASRLLQRTWICASEDGVRILLKILLHVLGLGGDVLRLGELLLFLVDPGCVGQYRKLAHQHPPTDPPCWSSANREAEDRAIRPKVTTKGFPRWQAK